MKHNSEHMRCSAPVEESTNTEDTLTQLVHPELSYEVRGVLFHVYNALGPMLAEEHYKEAIAIGLDKRRIRCETEKVFLS